MVDCRHDSADNRAVKSPWFTEGGIQQHGRYGYGSLAALAQVCTAQQLATPHDSPSRPHHQQRCKSTATGSDVNSDMTSRLFVGAYTLVTKSLWQERLSKRGTPPQDAALPPVMDKHPHVTSVQYPFTTDREFLEMVRFLHALEAVHVFSTSELACIPSTFQSCPYGLCANDIAVYCLGCFVLHAKYGPITMRPSNKAQQRHGTESEHLESKTIHTLSTEPSCSVYRAPAVLSNHSR